jgi:hypothetical protein
MKHLSALVILCVSLLVDSAVARLGETSDECNLRYGERYTETVGQGFWAAERKYEANGVRVIVRFLRADHGPMKAEYIEYRPTDVVSNRLSDAKITGLLQNYAAEWTKLTPLEIPPVPVKPQPDPSKTLVPNTKKRVITISETTGFEKKQAEKAARERKELLDSIAARNKEVADLKSKIGKMGCYSETVWQARRGYAASSYACLVMFTETYMRAFDHQQEIEQARKAKSDATPLKGL